MRNVQTKVTDSEYRMLEEIARKKGVSIYRLIREIIVEYLAKNTDDPKDLPVYTRLEAEIAKLKEEIALLKAELRKIEALYMKKGSMDRYLKRR